MPDHESARFLEQKYHLYKQYLLYVGNLLPHKNVELLLSAFSMVSRDIESDLVIIGHHPKFAKSIKETAYRLGVYERVSFIEYVDEHELPFFYSNSRAFITLSKLEGFGLPVVEALASGVPTIVSNAACLPEIVGDAALVVDIENIDEIVGSLIEIERNEILRSEISEKAIAQAKKFSWLRCARETLELYEEVTT
jgi:glycosyltransferase involved in cell wall biosynthesis